MVKKIISITLVLCLMVITFAGCKKGNEKSSTNTSLNSSSTTPKITVAKTSPTSSAVNTASPTPSATSATSAGAVTDYSIDVDFQIKVEVAGIVFGYTAETDFLMWQINAKDTDEIVYFRPHIWNAGAATVIDEKDISSVIKWEDRYKTHHMKVTVDSKNEIKTYVDNTLVDTYTDAMAAYGKFGIRENMGVEEAYFDNIIIKNTLNNQVLIQIDFNSNINPFSDSSSSQIVSGIMGDSPALQISKCSGSSDISVLP